MKLDRLTVLQLEETTFGRNFHSLLQFVLIKDLVMFSGVLSKEIVLMYAMSFKKATFSLKIYPPQIWRSKNYQFGFETNECSCLFQRMEFLKRFHCQSWNRRISEFSFSGHDKYLSL
jgi:hypothetical protein